MAAATLSPALAARFAVGKAVLVADTHSSLVFRASRPDGETVVVKQLKPEGMGELPGMDFLQWRDGSGAVRLLDRQDHACLLEDAGTITLADHYRAHGDDPATDIILDVLARLHAPSPFAPPAALVPLERHFRALFERAGRETDAALAAPLRWCAGLARELLADQHAIRPLHGDLHHDNIGGGGPRGWLALDPQGLIGDPAYETANVFGNPEGAGADILDPGRALRLSRRFARALDCSAAKILRHAAAHAGLSACWSLEDDETPAGSANLRERLAFARLARRLLEDMRQ